MWQDKYIFPLLDTTFEGVQAKIPYRYKEILASEYGKGALSKTDYHEYDLPLLRVCMSTRTDKGLVTDLTQKRCSGFR